MNAAIDYRSKFQHFRTLIIGRANAGKTTLLKKVCNSIEDPEIFSPSGKKLDPTVVQESSERGIHDIENELIFRSNPQFIFHDSRGFESGSLDEILTVKSFIADRAQNRDLAKQLHAIWYCLPTDNNRPLLDADRNFFVEYGNGKVPVIAIFTKFDGLVSTAFGELRDKEKLSIKEAKNKKFGRAQEKLKTHFVDPLQATACRPSAYVRLEDMRKEDSNCDELIEKTANVLDDDRLKLLFVSVQQNNIDICILYALKSMITLIGWKKANVQSIVNSGLAWFPHVWWSFVGTFHPPDKDTLNVVPNIY
jgi:GTP-binding protein EngB required for normal cell division